MYLVSNFKKSLLMAVMFIVVFGSVLMTDTSDAQATVTKPAIQRQFEVFPAGVLGFKQSTQMQTPIRPTIEWPSLDDVTSFLNEVACDASPGVGLALSMTTGVCDDTLIGSVGETVQKAVDCGLDIPLCINNWIYNVVGSGVSWVAKGIVDLVAGIDEACDTGVNSGSGDWASVGADCESRIKQDYFPAGYIREKKLSDVIARSYVDQRADITKQMRALRKTPGGRYTPEYANLANQLDMLDNRTADTPLSAEMTVAQLAGQNSIFSVPKSAVSTPTWDREYGKYVLIGVMLLVPMIIAACLQAVISGKGQVMLKAVIVHLPVAIIGMIIAPWLVRSFMAITDNFSAFIISDVRGDVDGFFSNMNLEAQAAMGPALLMGFVLVALVFMFAAILIWFVLSMREASVALISAFLPVALAASVWPALGKWALRAIKLIMAAIISKIFIVGALSLGLGTFTGSTDTGNISISHMIFGATIFFIAAFSPHLVMKFFDEIGDALNAAGGTGALARGLSVGGNANGVKNLLAGGGGGIGGMIGGGSGGGGSSTSPSSGGATAQLGAELSSGSQSEKAAAASRIAKADGKNVSGIIDAGGQGGGAGGGTPSDMLKGAYDSAMSEVAPGVAPGSATPEQGQAVGSAVTEAAMRNGVSQPEATAMGQDAAGYAMNGTSGAGSPGAPPSVQAGVANHANSTAQSMRQEAAAQRAASDPARPASKLKMAGAAVFGPVGVAAYLANNARKNENARQAQGWR